MTKPDTIHTVRPLADFTVDTVRRPLLLSLLTALSVFGTTSGHAAEVQGKVPRVVVNILVDQLRTDYLNAFMPLYGQEGFVRLMQKGRVYRQAEYPHAESDRASAAATLATGTTPYNHGIVGLKWLDRETLRPIFCVEDKTQNGVGTTDAYSPKFLGVSTVGDELKVATEGKALVYAIAPNAESAVLSAGHAADGAIWIDSNNGNWVTTSYYGGNLPSWAGMLNGTRPLHEKLKRFAWKPTNNLVGNFSYFLSGGMKEPFSHKFVGDAMFASYKTSGPVNEDIAAAASACMRGTMMGADAVTDYLAVTFYAGNFEHRTASEAPMELQDTYVRLDRAVAELIKAVESKVGNNNALFVLTSTGYADEETADLSKYRIPTGTFDVKRAAGLLNMYLVAVYGQGNYIESCFGKQLYLNHKLIEDKQINQSEMLERVEDFLLQLSGVKDVYTSGRLIQGAWTPGISRLRSAYNPRYSGDVWVEVTPGWRYVNADTGENKLVRESYVPFPVVFYGCGVTPDTIGEPVTIDYIAPTLSKAMRIRAPNACAVAPLF